MSPDRKRVGIDPAQQRNPQEGTTPTETSHPQGTEVNLGDNRLGILYDHPGDSIPLDSLFGDETYKRYLLGESETLGKIMVMIQRVPYKDQVNFSLTSMTDGERKDFSKQDMHVDNSLFEQLSVTIGEQTPLLPIDSLEAVVVEMMGDHDVNNLPECGIKADWHELLSAYSRAHPPMEFDWDV